MRERVRDRDKQGDGEAVELGVGIERQCWGAAPVYSVWTCVLPIALSYVIKVSSVEPR